MKSAHTSFFRASILPHILFWLGCCGVCFAAPLFLTWLALRSKGMIVFLLPLPVGWCVLELYRFMSVRTLPAHVWSVSRLMIAVYAFALGLSFLIG